MMSIESLRLLVANALETNFNYFIADIPTPIEAGGDKVQMKTLK